MLPYTPPTHPIPPCFSWVFLSSHYPFRFLLDTHVTFPEFSSTWHFAWKCHAEVDSGKPSISLAVCWELGLLCLPWDIPESCSSREKSPLVLACIRPRDVHCIFTGDNCNLSIFVIGAVETEGLVEDDFFTFEFCATTSLRRCSVVSDAGCVSWWTLSTRR